MLGDKLRLLRENRKLERNEVAEIIGVSTSAIVNYENNARTPDIYTLAKLVKLYNISLDELLDLNIDKQYISIDDIRKLQKDINEKFDEFINNYMQA